MSLIPLTKVSIKYAKSRHYNIFTILPSPPVTTHPLAAASHVDPLPSFPCADVWYVNADGQEGWVPAELLRLMTEEDIESSRESTPADLLSSADHSEMSDDGEYQYG